MQIWKSLDINGALKIKLFNLLERGDSKMSGNNNHIVIREDGEVSIDKDNLGELSNTSGTSLIDYITATYEELVNTFGEPNSATDEYKTDAEWTIDTPDGVATIYNYKNGHNYLGKDGMDVWDITEWHIGGHSPSIMEWILEALEKS